ncbi:MAG: sensor histidine kinase [Chitinophagaceae bacterium]
MQVRLYNKKGIQVLLHIAVWSVVFSLPFLMSSAYGGRHPKDPDSDGFFLLNLLTGVCWVGVFYLNAFSLTPRLIYKKKYFIYLVVLIVILGFVMLIHGILFSWLIKDREFILLISVWVNLSAFLLTIAASTVYQMMKDRMKADRMAEQKQAENLKTELSFLRSQISPHFVFNILNNITALARLKSDELEPTVMKLSSLMRYMLYETNEEKVSLHTEVEYLQSYIDLQQQRFGSKAKICISLETGNGNAYEIEPMLLIPFVENAFKHGIGMIQNPEINVALTIKDSVLFFSVSNKYSESTAQEIKDKTSGIGLTNVKRRLNLLYQKNHQLLVSKKEGWFLVSLQLNLH